MNGDGWMNGRVNWWVDR